MGLFGHFEILNSNAPLTVSCSFIQRKKINQLQQMLHFSPSDTAHVHRKDCSYKHSGLCGLE